MIIGITGSSGLLGWHTRALLKIQGMHEARLATRATFESPDLLAAFTKGLDGLIHLAGMNRGAESEVEAVNVQIAERLVRALEATEAKPHIAFANSMHVDQNTGYGRGKRTAATLLRNWAARSGGRFANLIFPHVFGEFGRPFYNSVVSTFCYQLARSESPTVINDGRVELLHVQDAAAHCVAAIEGASNVDVRVQGTPLRVSELLERLRLFQRCYGSQLLPRLNDKLDIQLFNTYRSYLFPGQYPIYLALHSDERGSLFEAIKSRGGGQAFLSTTRPGVTRGDHFHTRKIERFLVTAGEAEIRLRRLFTDVVDVFRVSGARPAYIDIPTFHAHNIVNVGKDDLITLFWSNEIFDPQDSDTYHESVHGQ